MTKITKEAVGLLLERYTINSNAGKAKPVANCYTRGATIMSSGKLWANGYKYILARLVEEYYKPGRQPPKPLTQHIEVDDEGTFAFADETLQEPGGRIAHVRMCLVMEDGKLKIASEWILFRTHPPIK